ncbi:hypothetical protein CVT26_003001 [Gymnopilus dilepis]|uniref:Uncharacterized protein n=1 Tax=Gymnopilus dilepis TaxID=231916 RepID=A0A409Y4D8_9AGAR|nr:hypothetical protein CVT26_003001 [Gymnopilus dilepis]
MTIDQFKKAVDTAATQAWTNQFESPSNRGRNFLVLDSLDTGGKPVRRGRKNTDKNLQSREKNWIDVYRRGYYRRPAMPSGKHRKALELLGASGSVLEHEDVKAVRVLSSNPPKK